MPPGQALPNLDELEAYCAAGPIFMFCGEFIDVLIDPTLKAAAEALECPVILDEVTTSPPNVGINGSTVLVQGAPNPFELVVQDPDGDIVDCALNAAQGQAELTSGFGQLLNDGLHMLMTPAFQSAPFFYQADTFDGLGFEDTITASCTDANGLTDSTSIDVRLNALPQAAPQSATLDEDSALNIALNVSDADGDSLSVSLSSPPAHGSASCAGTSCSYTPEPDYFGPDGFGYVAEDGFGGVASAGVSLTVNPVNDAPQLSAPGGLSVYEGQSANTQATCSDIDNSAAQLSLSATGLPPGGSFSSATSGGQKTGTLSVAPGFDAAQHPSTQGTFSGSIQCSDGDLTVTQAFSVTIEDVNRPPSAGNDSASTMEGVAVNVGVLANDSDPDGDGLTITQVGNPGNGSTSGGGGAGGQVLTEQSNYRPTAIDDVVTTDEDTPVVIAVLANDFDEEGDPITLGAVGPADFGTVTANPEDTVTYTPDPDFFGEDTFMYEVCDDGGLCATGTVTVTVNPVNDPPLATDDTYSTPPNPPLGFLKEDISILQVSGHYNLGLTFRTFKSGTGRITRLQCGLGEFYERPRQIQRRPGRYPRRCPPGSGQIGGARDEKSR